jgi:putative ABC transport system permease protein
VTGFLRVLHLRQFRRHPARAILTALSIAAGVALAVSVVVVQTSFDRSITSFGRTLAGPAPLRVVGPAARGGLDARVVDRIRAVPGVGVAVPLVQAFTTADSADGERSELGTAIGADWSMEALFGRFGCDGAATTPLVSARLARRLGPGATLRSDVRSVPLDGAATSSRLDGINRGSAVIDPLAVSQQLFARPGAVDGVYVTPAPGTPVETLRARLADAVGPQNGVLSSADPPPGMKSAAAFVLALLGLLSLFALAVGGMLARNSVVLSLVERRRDLAVAAAVGATPRMLTTGILAEVAIVGAAGGAIGAFGGVLLAKPVLDGIDRFVARAIGAHLTVHASPAVIGLSIALGLGAAVLATWRPARQAARLDIAAELSSRDTAEEAAVSTHVKRAAILIAIGVAGVVAAHVASSGGGLEPWQPIATELGVVVASVGLIGSVGTLAPIVATLVGRVLHGAPGAARLGIANVARSRRTGVMTIAVASAVGVAFSIASTTRSIHDAVTSDILSSGDRVSINTVPVSNSINIEGKPWPSTMAALAKIPGVASVDEQVVMLVRQPDGSTIGVSASDGDPPLRLDGDLVRGTADQARFARGEVVIGPNLARRFHVHPGDRIAVAGRDGVVDVTVQGVEQFGDFNGTLVRMPMSMVTRLYGEQPPAFVSLLVKPGADPVAVARAVEAAHLQPHLEASPPREIAETIAGEVSAQVSPFWALQRSLVVVAFVAVLFTLLLSAVQRRRELGVLGAIGMRPSEIAAMVISEGAAVALIGAVLGTLASIGFILAMGDAVAVVIGFQDPLRFDLLAPVAWGVVVLALVLVAASWPAWRAARTEVLPALQYE